MEYWYCSICSAYVVANEVTGELEYGVDGRFLREFASANDALAAYPNATRCFEMED